MADIGPSAFVPQPTTGPSPRDTVQSYAQQTIGRPLTASEIDYIHSKGYNVQDSKSYINGINQNAQQIYNEAQSLGLPFTLDQAAKLRDQYSDPAHMTEISDQVRNVLERNLNEQTVSKQQDAINRQLHPEQFLNEQQKGTNLDQANQVIKSVYGQDYQDTEGLGNFLAQEIAKGQSPYEISQFLKTTPTYLQQQADLQQQKYNTQADQARQALDQSLQQSQQQVFEKAAPNIIAQFMKAGRLNSSGLQSALAQAQAQLDQQRQSQLAGAGYQQAVQGLGYNQGNFVNAQNAAFQNYAQQSAPLYQQAQNLQNYGNYANFQAPIDYLNRQFGLGDQARQRQYQVQDYNRQQNDYQRYLDQANQNARDILPYQIGGALAGSAIQGLAQRR